MSKIKLFDISNWKIEENLYKCPICSKEYSKYGMVNHYYRKHTEQGKEWIKKFSAEKFNTKSHIAWNKGLNKDSDNRLKIQGEKLHQKYINGEITSSWIGKHHSEESKRLMSESARKSNHRRLLRSCRYYIQKDGTKVLLDSSWEERLAKLLDNKNIEWIRPKDTLKWIDKEGKSHNYFPDFYLPKYDVYLDPKNPQACRVQKEKLDIILEEYKNIIILHSEEEIDNIEDILLRW